MSLTCAQADGCQFDRTFDGTTLVTYFFHGGVDFDQNVVTFWTGSSTNPTFLPGAYIADNLQPVPGPGPMFPSPLELDITDTPEPTTFVMLGAGLLALACLKWRYALCAQISEKDSRGLGDLT